GRTGHTEQQQCAVGGERRDGHLHEPPRADVLGRDPVAVAQQVRHDGLRGQPPARRPGALAAGGALAQFAGELPFGVLARHAGRLGGVGGPGGPSRSRTRTRSASSSSGTTAITASSSSPSVARRSCRGTANSRSNTAVAQFGSRAVTVARASPRSTTGAQSPTTDARKSAGSPPV